MPSLLLEPIYCPVHNTVLSKRGYSPATGYCEDCGRYYIKVFQQTEGGFVVILMPDRYGISPYLVPPKKK
jgi:hypothetical protein